MLHYVQKGHKNVQWIDETIESFFFSWHRNKYKCWSMRKGEDWIIQVVSMECDGGGVVCVLNSVFSWHCDYNGGGDGHQPGEVLRCDRNTGWVMACGVLQTLSMDEGNGAQMSRYLMVSN